ncbi:MAG: hypothetical protein EBZ48_00165 [Proteobacteria bacterium]|nr:hypothetical protein [Pseudomonadota bacterium]
MGKGEDAAFTDITEASELDEVDEPVAAPSDIARAVERLRSASFRTAREREHVPQPLFWSLFSSELQSIKSKKRAARQLSSIFGGGGQE